MVAVTLEIQETKATVAVVEQPTSLVVDEQNLALTVAGSDVLALSVVSQPVTLTVDNSQLSLAVTESVNSLSFGNAGIQGIQGVQGATGPSGVTSSAGVATLDFGAGGMTAETVVTGYAEVTADSVVMASVRVVATAEHATDDLLVDPIRLAVKDLVAGAGFTIYGEMDNAEANGTYQINWLIR
jgi:hypothetical protein